MKSVYILTVAVLLSACGIMLEDVVHTRVNWNDVDGVTALLPQEADALCNGAYDVLQGSERFGSRVALRIVRGNLCIWSSNDVLYLQLAGGIAKDSCSFRGFYRAVRGSETGAVGISIATNEGVQLIQGLSTDTTLILRGYYERGSTRYPLVLKRCGCMRTPQEFYVIAHRGGGRNSDRLGASENSIELIGMSEMLGANAIEIDIKRTSDNQLIVFHDETFSPRTVQGAYILGLVRKHSLSDIQRYARLVNGERIPTMREALRYVIDSTTLKLVWLDVKDADIASGVIDGQREALEYAQQQGRSIRILFGIPTPEILNAYRSAPNKNTTPVLCELSQSDVSSLPTCEIWAPRWTSDLSTASVATMRGRGINVLTWTLDVTEFMQTFVARNDLNGILTNYPSLLAGIYHQQLSR